MAKFLSIPVTSKGNQLLSLDSIVLIAQASTTTVTVTYVTGKIATVTHATAGASDYTMRDVVQDAMVEALQDSWTHVVYPAEGINYAVSGIAVA